MIKDGGKSRNQMLDGYVKWLSISKNEIPGLLPEALVVSTHAGGLPHSFYERLSKLMQKAELDLV